MPQVLKNEIRDRVIEAALQNFMEKGYSSTSMKDIASGSGIAVGNIYRYYKNKEELYDAIAMPVYNAINGLFKNPPEDLNPQGIEKKVMAFIEIYKKNRKVFIMLLDRSKQTKLEDMIKTIVTEFSNAIMRWRKQINGISSDIEEQVFIKAFTTAYISGIISILSDPSDEETMTARLYAFLTFMKDGLYRKYTEEGTVL